MREARTFPYSIFIDEITRYYDKRGCGVEFEIGADGSVIWAFNIKPHGKLYHHKLIPDETWEDWQAEALFELKTIFFPDEDLTVEAIYQYPEIEAADITLLVSPNSLVGAPTEVGNNGRTTDPESSAINGRGSQITAETSKGITETHPDQACNTKA